MLTTLSPFLDRRRNLQAVSAEAEGAYTFLPYQQPCRKLFGETTERLDLL
jgi:hypothetical protein